VSTLKTTNLQHPDAVSPNIVLTAGGGVEMSGYLYAGTRYYTSSGTFAKADPLGTGDIGLRAIRVRVQGGGGAGGGADETTATQNSHGAGGGSGTYAEAFITDIAGLASSVTVTLGAGGAGVSSDAGNAGGQSSFGGLLECPGGDGGAYRSPNAGATTSATGGSGGGAATGTVTPDLSVPGVEGGSSFGVNPALAVGGVGASSFLGFASGARARLSTSSISSLSQGFGSGGSGAMAVVSNTTARAGRGGQAGIVIVEVYV
jgi:hypothetical protein